MIRSTYSNFISLSFVFQCEDWPYGRPGRHPKGGGGIETQDERQETPTVTQCFTWTPRN